MNNSKARDYFSEYYEGTLDASLKQVFERALASDSHLKEEYQEFCSFISDIDSLRECEAPLPNFLHERIMTRVDEQEAVAVAQRGGWLQRFWRPLAYTGIAATALIGAVFAINMRGSGNIQGGSNLPITVTQKMPALKMDAGQVKVVWTNLSEAQVTIKMADGEIQERSNLSPNQGISQPINNLRDNAELVVIDFGTDARTIQVVIPGQTKSTDAKGSGTVLELAKAIADYYGSPVQFDVKDLNHIVTWNFKDSKDAIDAVNNKVDNVQLELRENIYNMKD